MPFDLLEPAWRAQVGLAGIEGASIYLTPAWKASVVAVGGAERRRSASAVLSCLGARIQSRADQWLGLSDELPEFDFGTSELEDAISAIAAATAGAWHS
jgi:hypothetical protein